MKTFEELEIMTVPQLKGIAQSLGADVPSNIKKPALVQLVYDIQQPAPPEENQNNDAPEDESKPVTTDAEIAERRQVILEHFDAEELEEDGDNGDGATVFKVMDLVGDEVARGTLVELYALATASAEPEPESDAGFTETPLDDVDTSTPAINNEDAVGEVQKALNALAPYGLRYAIDGSTIKLSAGSRSVTTTLNQPAHRVVKTAEQLCNFR